MASPPKGYVLLRYPNALTAEKALALAIESREDRVTHVLALVEACAEMGYTYIKYEQGLHPADVNALKKLGYDVRLTTGYDYIIRWETPFNVYNNGNDA